jgi:hypothetical protein
VRSTSEYTRSPYTPSSLPVICYQVISRVKVIYYSLPYTGEEYLRIHEESLHALFPTCDLLPVKNM